MNFRKTLLVLLGCLVGAWATCAQYYVPISKTGSAPWSRVGCTDTLGAGPASDSVRASHKADSAKTAAYAYASTYGDTARASKKADTAKVAPEYIPLSGSTGVYGTIRSSAGGQFNWLKSNTVIVAGSGFDFRGNGTINDYTVFNNDSLYSNHGVLGKADSPWSYGYFTNLLANDVMPSYAGGHIGVEASPWHVGAFSLLYADTLHATTALITNLSTPTVKVTTQAQPSALSLSATTPQVLVAGGAFTLTLPAASSTYAGMTWMVYSTGYAITYAGTLKYCTAPGTWTTSSTTYASGAGYLKHVLSCDGATWYLRLE